jgi:hypothetical protein
MDERRALWTSRAKDVGVDSEVPEESNVMHPRPLDLTVAPSSFVSVCASDTIA